MHKISSPKNIKSSILLAGIIAAICLCCCIWPKQCHKPDDAIKDGDFWVYDKPTPNVSEGENKVQGIVLHHTAASSINGALSALRDPRSKVSAHVLIDKDGTRYILAQPTQITWHAGYSHFRGKNWCNNFTIGIEFQGNTCRTPLTEEQIQSAIDYILPIMSQYGIKEKNIVTHEFIRKEWNRVHPNRKQVMKVDITEKEYKRFRDALSKRKAEVR